MQTPESMKPLDIAIGTVLLDPSPITINQGRDVCTVEVTNAGRRTIQVGSHFHFFEVNRDLQFPRAAAFGLHLDIPSGTAVRFAPGERKTVSLTLYAGQQTLIGFNGLTQGDSRDPEIKRAALDRARRLGFWEEESP